MTPNAKNTIQLYWAINNCIETFFKENPDANPKDYYLSIEKGTYWSKKETGQAFDVTLVHKSEADIFNMPCLDGLYEDIVDQDNGDVVAQPILDKVSPIIDDWFRYNK